MISILERPALEFFKHSTSSLKSSVTFSGDGFYVQHRLLCPFPTHRQLWVIYILLCTMPCLQRPLSVFQRVRGLLCPGRSPNVWVPPEKGSQFPPPTWRKGLGFPCIRTMPASCQSTYMTLYCIRFLCRSSDPILWNP